MPFPHTLGGSLYGPLCLRNHYSCLKAWLQGPFLWTSRLALMAALIAGLQA